MHKYELTIYFGSMEWGRVTLPQTNDLATAIDKAALLQASFDAVNTGYRVDLVEVAGIMRPVDWRKGA